MPRRVYEPGLCPNCSQSLLTDQARGWLGWSHKRADQKMLSSKWPVWRDAKKELYEMAKISTDTRPVFEGVSEIEDSDGDDDENYQKI